MGIYQKILSKAWESLANSLVSLVSLSELSRYAMELDY